MNSIFVRMHGTNIENEMKLIIEVRRRAPSLSASHHIRAAPQHKCRTAVWLSY
jgi:sulfur transfer protein SufE